MAGAMQRLNPHLPETVLDDALARFCDRRVAMTLIAANRELDSTDRFGPFRSAIGHLSSHNSHIGNTLRVRRSCAPINYGQVFHASRPHSFFSKGLSCPEHFAHKRRQVGHLPHRQTCGPFDFRMGRHSCL